MAGRALTDDERSVLSIFRAADAAMTLHEVDERADLGTEGEAGEIIAALVGAGYLRTAVWSNAEAVPVASEQGVWEITDEGRAALA